MVKPFSQVGRERLRGRLEPIPHDDTCRVGRHGKGVKRRWVKSLRSDPSPDRTQRLDPFLALGGGIEEAQEQFRCRALFPRPKQHQRLGIELQGTPPTIAVFFDEMPQGFDVLERRDLGHRRIRALIQAVRRKRRLVVRHEFRTRAWERMRVERRMNTRNWRQNAGDQTSTDRFTSRGPFFGPAGRPPLPHRRTRVNQRPVRLQHRHEDTFTSSRRFRIGLLESCIRPPNFFGIRHERMQRDKPRILGLLRRLRDEVQERNAAFLRAFLLLFLVGLVAVFRRPEDVGRVVDDEIRASWLVLGARTHGQVLEFRTYFAGRHGDETDERSVVPQNQLIIDRSLLEVDVPESFAIRVRNECLQHHRVASIALRTSSRGGTSKTPPVNRASKNNGLTAAPAGASPPR